MLLPLNWIDVTINISSLFGFILVLGIVVDDAIVIGESAYSEIENKGTGVNKIAEAFGMQVIYAGLPGRAHNSAIERVAFDAFLARADIISIHCPLTADTRDLIGEAQFALMQSSTLVINSARGGIVNEAALKQALCNGDIAGAATDVLTVEPPVDGNLLLDPSIPNLIVTPHSAWVAQEARQRLIVQLAENIGGVLDGKPRNQVN
jgi:glycerate dehydrogenase